MNCYIYRWTEGNSPAFEVTGDAWSIYRVGIMVRHRRDHVNGQIFSSESRSMNIDQFMKDITKEQLSKEVSPLVFRSIVERICGLSNKESK